jgi:hypothetical protein
MAILQQASSHNLTADVPLKPLVVSARRGRGQPTTLVKWVRGDAEDVPRQYTWPGEARPSRPDPARNSWAWANPSMHVGQAWAEDLGPIVALGWA